MHMSCLYSIFLFCCKFQIIIFKHTCFRDTALLWSVRSYFLGINKKKISLSSLNLAIAWEGLIFFSISLVICFGYSLEVPQKASNEYPQHMFSWNKIEKYLSGHLIIWNYECIVATIRLNIAGCRRHLSQRTTKRTRLLRSARTDQAVQSDQSLLIACTLYSLCGYPKRDKQEPLPLIDWLSWGLTTRQPLWVILCRLPEKGRK